MSQPPGWGPMQPQLPAQVPTFWEYRVLVLYGVAAAMEPQLQQLGREGWELVHLTFQQGFAGHGNITTPLPVGIFKRPLIQSR